MIKRKVVEIPEHIRNILLSADIEGNVLRITQQLERETYVQVNKVLEALGGKWNRSLRGHVFNQDPAQKIAEALQAGEAVDVKKTFEFFETPDALANRIVAEANLEDGDLVLEPSAGKGAIADVARAACPECTIHVAEIEAEKRDILKEKGYKIVAKDFLKYRKRKPLYDAIVMNPPFSRQQDIDHVLHAWKFLKPGGRLVAVMSAGTEFRSNKKAQAFRGLVQEAGGIIEPLPPETFRESGTTAGTVLVILDK